MKWETNSSEQEETPGDSYSLKKYQFIVFMQISNEEFLNALFKQIYPR